MRPPARIPGASIRARGEHQPRRQGKHLLVFLAAAILALLGTSLSAAANGLLEDAIRQFDLGNYQHAASILTGATDGEKGAAAGESAARLAAVYHWLARCYFELGQFDRAVSSAERSVQLEPANSLYHQWLGRAYGRKAEHAAWFSALSLAKKTRREFEEAVRLKPSNFEARHDLIEFYLRAPGIVGGGDEKGRQQAEAVAALDPAEGHLGLALYWSEKKKLEQADAKFRRMLEAKPKRLELYFEAANFYQNRSDTAGMRAAVEAAARLDAADRRLSYYRGVALVLAKENLSEAEPLLKTYIGKVPPRSDLPTHASALEWLGRLYELQGKPDAAAEQYRAALKLEPQSKTAREALRRLGKK